MEAPFEKLLEELEQPASMIFGDVELRWLVGVGNRRNIPVASLWTMSASFFSLLFHYVLNSGTKSCNLPLDSSRK